MSSQTSEEFSLLLTTEQYNYLKLNHVIPYRRAFNQGNLKGYLPYFWFCWFDRFPVVVSPIETSKVVQQKRRAVKRRVKSVMDWLNVSYRTDILALQAPIVISDDEEEEGTRGNPIVVSDDDNE
ncbi:hypothetical protein ONZ45_g12927 [Pleurotus djamor]|nr:hypothetical protein ONZ45_g12927 [Pleurotus djamor]